MNPNKTDKDFNRTKIYKSKLKSQIDLIKPNLNDYLTALVV